MKGKLRIFILLLVIYAGLLFVSANANADNYGTSRAESERMEALIYRTFGPGPTGRCFIRIMWRESGGNPRAANYNDWYGGSYGLLQLNAVHRWQGESMHAFQLRQWNPRTHLIAAKRLYDSSGFRAWGGCP